MKDTVSESYWTRFHGGEMHMDWQKSNMEMVLFENTLMPASVWLNPCEYQNSQNKTWITIPADGMKLYMCKWRIQCQVQRGA